MANLTKFLFLALFAAPLAGCVSADPVPCVTALPEAMQAEIEAEGRARSADMAALYPYFRCLARHYDHEGAQYRLGVAKEEGLGTEQDVRRAIYWYREAGYPKSGLDFKTIPARGDERFDMVIPWRAGEPSAGHPDAQYRLGLIYLKQGKPDSARLWLGRAAKQGHAGARERLEELSGDDLDREAGGA